jgi:transcriptional regulator with XRE-family HTH domain
MGQIRSLPTRRFVKLLEDYMAENRCSQQAVADKIGIAQNYVSKLIRGVRNEVTGEVLERAIENLKIHHDYFFDPDIEAKGLTYKDFTVFGMRDAIKRGEKDHGSGPRRSPLSRPPAPK